MGMTIVLGLLRWQWSWPSKAWRCSWRTTEISLVAHFFNSFLLGSTGGDLLKAYYAARETHHKKTEAVMTVLVDRLVGLFAMLLFACLMMFPNLALLRNIGPLAALAGFIRAHDGWMRHPRGFFLLGWTLKIACLGPASGCEVCPSRVARTGPGSLPAFGRERGSLCRGCWDFDGFELFCVLQIMALARGCTWIPPIGSLRDRADHRLHFRLADHPERPWGARESLRSDAGRSRDSRRSDRGRFPCRYWLTRVVCSGVSWEGLFI